MSQEQQRRPEAVKYGDVFNVSGELASKPVAPQDAATMQSAETIVLGMTPAGGPAAIMKSAADVNETRGVVRHQDITDLVRDHGVAISDAEVAGRHVIAEAVAGQVVGIYAQPGGQGQVKSTATPTRDQDPITIGEALEATVFSAGDKPISEPDAAAIQAAEVRATGLGRPIPGGIAAEAQSAAMRNPRATRDEDKTTLGDVLSDATAKLPHDKPVTRKDAAGVVAAEVRNDPHMAPHPGGVAASVAAAARLNLGK